MPRADGLPPAGTSPEDLVPAAEFNVRDFARSAAGSHRAGLELDAYVDHPLDADTLWLTAYLARLERSTMRHLRSVLVTPTHKDARVTAFLVTWAYEKYWVADALQAILEVHTPSPVLEEAAAQRPGFWRVFAERIEPMRESVVANLIGEDVIAAHTTTGAVDEWITRAAFETLVSRTDHAVFRRTLGELLEVKRRHEEFWTLQTRDRLRRSRSAARLARRRLVRAHLPLGTAEEAPGPTARFYRELLPAAAIAEIDGRVDALPGFAGLHVVRRSAAGALRRTARTERSR